MDRTGRQSVVGEVNALLMRFHRRRSALELGDDEEKLRMIGAQLDAHVREEWLSRYGYWLNWLAERGKTESDALLAWRQWTSRVKVVRKPKAEIVRKTRRRVNRGEGE